MNLRRVLSAVLLLGYLTLLLITSIWPKPVDGGGVVWFVTSQILKFARGISWLNWLQYNQLESIANVLLYVPLGVFLVLFLPRVKTWVLCLIPLLVTALAESFQRWFLPERYSTLDDVLHNSLGGLLGVLISVSIRRLMRMRAKARSTSQGR